MSGFKVAWQLLWHIPIAITWMLMGLLITITYGVNGFDRFIIDWNRMVKEIGDDL